METTTTPPHTALRCPACSSEQVQALKLVHAIGTQHTESTTIGGGLGFGVGGMLGGLGLGATTGITTNEVARRLAPPAPRSTFLQMLGVFFGGALALFGLLCASLVSVAYLLALAAGVLLAVCSHLSFLRVREFNETVHAERYDRWSRSFLCLRCARVFDPE